MTGASSSNSSSLSSASSNSSSTNSSNGSSSSSSSSPSSSSRRKLANKRARSSQDACNMSTRPPARNAHATTKVPQNPTAIVPSCCTTSPRYPPLAASTLSLISAWLRVKRSIMPVSPRKKTIPPT
ncbi:hypothetical protein COV06_02060 [Candidatus Uhrbacteria bacterium CG10_big_fil_rev_8_21_14_0_10_50_16]|uniref:Uncharacterized protein n=1 Tax=Candidatus Uhrbacteria bacterium CG10_big_fil_rev_8_21_14_0_10_50_16 TaxID=1975039 RepID=A0A2H0RMU0_9BACT|nr:MAG: hypothetical protein COV06_02060 [Candidatus Uhrbacteria bacterium CG10_big_fil_rev_8_21_14_0_10_50_16]